MGVSSRNENSFVSRRVHEDAESLLVADPKNVDIKNLVDVVHNLENLRGKPSSLEASGLVVHKYVCESAVGLKVVGHAEQTMKSRLDELTFSEVVAGLEERKEKLEVSGLFCQGSELVPNAFCNADVVKFVSSAHDLLRDLEKKRKRNSNACPYGLLFLQTQGILDNFWKRVSESFTGMYATFLDRFCDRALHALQNNGSSADGSIMCLQTWEERLSVAPCLDDDALNKAKVPASVKDIIHGTKEKGLFFCWRHSKPLLCKVIHFVPRLLQCLVTMLP